MIRLDRGAKRHGDHRATFILITTVLNNSTKAIYQDSCYLVVVERYNFKGLSGQFVEVGQAMGPTPRRSPIPRRSLQPSGEPWK